MAQEMLALDIGEQSFDQSFAYTKNYSNLLKMSATLLQPALNLKVLFFLIKSIF